MFFPCSKPTGVICDGFTVLIVDSGVHVWSLVADGLSYVFVFNISATYLLHSEHHPSGCLVTLFYQISNCSSPFSFLLCFVWSCNWIFWDLNFFHSSIFAQYSGPIHRLLLFLFLPRIFAALVKALFNWVYLLLMSWLSSVVFKTANRLVSSRVNSCLVVCFMSFMSNLVNFVPNAQAGWFCDLFQLKSYRFKLDGGQR